MVPLDPRTRVDHVALRVSDVEASAAFYSWLAGLEVSRERAVASLSSAGGARPLLRLRTAPQAGPAARRATGLFHTALRFSSRPELARALLRVVDRRWPLSGASDHGVSEALYLDDPDGLGIELTWDRPREAWPAPAPGQRVGMVTEPLDLEQLVATAAQEDPEPRVVIGHAHLKAGTLEREVAFWRELVGLEEMARYGNEAAFLAAGGYHHHLGINTWMSAGAGPEDQRRAGLDHVALALPGAAALEPVRARLRAAGVALESDEPERVSGRSPDGLGFELVAA